jgi:hypothetical protein
MFEVRCSMLDPGCGPRQAEAGAGDVLFEPDLVHDDGSAVVRDAIDKPQLAIGESEAR